MASIIFFWLDNNHYLSTEIARTCGCFTTQNVFVRSSVVRNLKKLGLSLLSAVPVLVLSLAQVTEGIAPFAVAYLFTLALVAVWKAVPVTVLVLSALWQAPSRWQMLCVLAAVAVFFATNFLLRFVQGKKKWYLPLLLVAFTVAQGLPIYLAYLHREWLVKTLIAVLVGWIFLAACFFCLKAFQQKKFLFPWTIDQMICLMCLVVVLALGLCGFQNDYFEIYQFVAVLITFWGVFYTDAKATVMVAAAVGLGKAFATGDLVFVAGNVLLCLACVAFKSRNRLYSIVAVVLTDLVIGLYFNGYGGYDVWRLLPLGSAVLVFLCLPSSWARFFTFGAGGLGGFLVSKNTINRNTAGISLRMRSLAAVFNEMQNTYRNLTHQALPPNETAVMICGEITANICANCPNKNICRKSTNSTKDVEEGITTLARVALKHNGATMLDVPNALSIKCTRINTLLAAVERSVTRTKNKAQIIAGLDSGKILMANLLSGISQLCSKFAHDVCRSVVFDNERGELVKEELLYKNIYAEDCLITKTSQNEFVVSVLVPRSDANNGRIEKVVSQVCGHKMIVDEVVDAATKGYSIVSVRSAPKYNLLFGMAGVTKGVNSTSGDNFSFLRVTNDKTLMALCDGMGAGERASRASTLALCLVENFYKAGFPDEIIMQSVNQLLTFTGQDIFSALDMSVFDLATGDVNFIKVGAPDGFIKRAQEVEVVEAGSLPLGILDEIEPKITKAILSVGDYVVLGSDGVVDAFGGERVALAGFINNLDANSAQELADKIMTEVLRRSAQYPADDCTVLVAQLTKM